MNKIFTLTAALLSFTIMVARAQTATDSTKLQSPVKTLSYERYNAYLKGIDVDNMAVVGEMNHYPTPDKVLKYQKEVGLTTDQVKKLPDIYADMHMHQVQAGQSMVRNEETLDEMFRTKKQLDNGSLIFFTNRYGLYMGEMRNAVLQACLKTQKYLPACK